MTTAPAPEPVARAVALERYRTALQRTLTAVPYNSATEFHRAFGPAPVDPRLGTVCIRQTLHAAESAVELGTPTPALLQDGRHVAAVFEDGGHLVVLDPYLLHLEPLVFPMHEVLAGSSTTTTEAAPVRYDVGGNERPARLEGRYSARGDGSYVIRLTYSRYSQRRNRYLIARHFSLRSTQVFDADRFSGDLASHLTHPEQTSMSVRAFDPTLRATVEAILPLEGFARRNFRRRDLWLRGPDGLAVPDNEAGVHWDRLTALLGLEAHQVADHLTEAGRIYQQVADPAIAVAPYVLDAE